VWRSVGLRFTHEALVLCTAVLAMQALFAQDTVPSKEFEVLSIRVAPELSMEEHRTKDPRTRLPQISPASVRMPYVSMEQILERAFGLARTQVVAPEWADSQHFSVAAKMPEGADQRDLPEMFRSMLRARFHMAYHTEIRDTRAVVLTLRKGGINAGIAAVESRPRGRPVGRLESHYELAATSRGLADLLERLTSLPVVDKTGLLGLYFFSFDFYPFGKLGEDGKPLEPPSSDFAAYETEHLDDALAPLGLRLALSKLPLEDVVIDHLDRIPTEN
jgi:uncharacterized protein (TIGR03435 family)